MCGILGIAAGHGRVVSLSDAAVCRLRDRLTHRGPDGAGLWRSEGGRFVLAHRRLAVIDPTPTGAQPMLLDDPSLGDRGRSRWALAYNGELYNDVELREELALEGAVFRTSCDTETLLHALARWGAAGVARLRGMFAFALVDRVRHTLLLARDPMGIKPLYYRSSDREVMFASEPGPILEHHDSPPRPDPVALSAYLTTIRTTLGERTMFEGVRCVRPGECLEFGLEGEQIRVIRTRIEPSPRIPTSGKGNRVALVRPVIEDSVRRHLRADVATCCLLSGGLDSSIIVAAARRHTEGEIRTYCSGHDDGADRGDLAFAELAAAHFGAKHMAAPVTRGMFAERWPDMVRRMGVPLSTPNEVAINEVARRLRADGQVVALSGEGADELFGGYELPMLLAAEFEEARRREAAVASHEAWAFQLRSNAWMTDQIKAAALRPEVWRGVEQDATLRAWYAEEFAGCGEGVQAHLTFHRRVNLAGLLARLDTATMLEGVEGRTPFADVRVCEFAESLPMSRKYDRGRAKIALRDEFADVVPREIVARPKASFPLPFQDWVGDSVGVLARSAFARTLFRDEAIDEVVRRPRELWNLAWPMVNLAMWGERWWRDGR